MSDVNVFVLGRRMDFIELMVAETFKHLHENFSDAEASTVKIVPEIKDEVNEYPAEPGILYHLQKSASLFVILPTKRSALNFFDHVKIFVSRNAFSFVISS